MKRQNRQGPRETKEKSPVRYVRQQKDMTRMQRKTSVTISRQGCIGEEGGKGVREEGSRRETTDAAKAP